MTAIAAHYRLGGDFWARKGASALAGEGEVTVWVKDQRVSMRPFGASDLKSVYSPARVSIETVDNDLIEILTRPRSSFDGHTRRSSWTDLQVAYFTGYAMWTDLAEPFSLTMPGVELRYDSLWQEGPDDWRRLRVHYPPTVVTHTAQQTLYVDDRGLIRRRDYDIDIAGGSRAAQYVSDFVSVGGIVMPTTRTVYVRDAADHPVRDQLEVSIELTDVRVL
ncbi:hypothetical protein [Mycobacterium sp. PS03-16]|uniref:hypothetical protein n=1 Tax=Mycobacterium sp. PS03-16 TaxID=2559611 RepID=UPI001FD72840|nr:hypothetical protein [Mycobacterium sp. PS03-16]